MNNIEITQKFFSEPGHNSLLINQVNEEIGSFYDCLFIELSKKYKVKIVRNTESIDIDHSNDLFQDKKVYIYKSTNIKNVKEILNKNVQKLIFTDYKNFKALSDRYDFINGYDFERDIRYLLKNISKIDNNSLINFCISHPYITFSEMAKHLINPTNYSVDPLDNDNHNFILDIRKDIFSLKKNKFDTRKVFLSIKKEAKYKKFNFLTY